MFRYDLGGNRLSQAVFDGTSTVTTNYAYNLANQITSDGTHTFTYDLNGNLTDDGLNAYTYDAANRLKTFTPDGGSATSYFYNGDGARYRQTTSGAQTEYLLDLTGELTQVLGEFAPGDTIYYLLGLDIIGQQNGSAWSYLGYDGLGSVRQLYDASGNVGYAASYDPYGVPLSQTGSLTSPLGFTGEYTDPSGLIYLRARYMHPALGAFLTRDPVMGVVGGQSIRWNSYLYAGANPANYLDPSGRFFWFPMLLGFALGAISSGAVNLGYQMLIEGKSWECVDKTSLGMAMLEGGILGAVGGALGASWNAAVKAGEVSARAAAWNLLKANYQIGVAWSMIFQDEDLGQALVSNAVGLGAGQAVGFLGGKVWQAAKGLWNGFRTGGIQGIGSAIRAGVHQTWQGVKRAANFAIRAPLSLIMGAIDSPLQPSLPGMEPRPQPKLPGAPPVNKRANILAGYLNPNVQRNKVAIGVGDAYDPVTRQTYRLVSVSDTHHKALVTNYIPREELRINNEWAVPPQFGTGHAEDNIVRYAQAQGWQIGEVGASILICKGCQATIIGAGGKPVGGLRP